VEDLEAVAEELRNRHGRSKRGRGPDSGVVPRRLLLPSVQDPSIWGVKCRPGKEREVLFSLLRKMEDAEGTKFPVPIVSAFEREAMQGYIYVEAYRQNDVLDALNGISNVYPRGPKILVPIKEMPDLLNVVKSQEIVPGTWVRFKRGKYQGDLAQVENVLSNGLEVRIRMVPRLDYGVNQDKNEEPSLPPGVKRKRNNNGFNKSNTVAGRPPQRLFSEIDATKHNPKLLAKGTISNAGRKNFTYQGEEYEDGYLVKDVRLTVITTENVNPTLEEVAKFASTVDEGAETLDLNALAQSLRSSVSTYQVGDTVEVYDGEQQGVIGKAVSVHGNVVTMDVLEGDLKGKRLDVPFKGLRKRFREGDHVKVTGGKYRDEIGTVVRIAEDKVTLVTGEENIEEITVFSKDLREATEAGGIGGGKYDLHELVSLEYVVHTIYIDLF
jgi:transcription elongation factor SPT5